MFQRFCTLALATTLLFCSAGCSSKASRRARNRAPVAFEKWQEFKAPDGTFSVFFPKMPKQAVKQAKTTDLNWYTASNKGESYYVSCSSTKDEEVAAVRDKDKEAEARRASLYSKTQKPITFCGEQAREMTWEENGYNYRGIVYKTHQGHHLYTLWARFKGAEPSNAQKFFASFKAGAYTPKPAPSLTPNDDEEASASATADEEDDGSTKAKDDDEGADD
jgi:hypothetical protein